MCVAIILYAQPSMFILSERLDVSYVFSYVFVTLDFSH